jgi:hypothetical protein
MSVRRFWHGLHNIFLYKNYIRPQGQLPPSPRKKNFGYIYYINYGRVGGVCVVHPYFLIQNYCTNFVEILCFGSALQITLFRQTEIWLESAQYLSSTPITYKHPLILLQNDCTNNCLKCVPYFKRKHRIGTGGRHLWMRKWTFRFHKMREISWLAEYRLASEERPCSMKYLFRTQYLLNSIKKEPKKSPV